jgi:hypothetical protein
MGQYPGFFRESNSIVNEAGGIRIIRENPLCWSPGGGKRKKERKKERKRA